MYLKVGRTINLFVAALMLLEILLTSATALSWTSCSIIYSEEYSEELPSSLLSSMLFEKAEEENEETEEEKCLLRVVLIDLSQIALSLSDYYSPDLNCAVNAIQYDVRPPVYQFNCVLLI